MRIPFTLIAACLLLTACSTTPPSHRSYLLRSSAGQETRELNVTAELSLGALTLASYIDQSGLVLEQANGTVHVAKQHHWAEPLRQSLRQFMCAELSAELGYDLVDSIQPNAGGRQLNISISHLHGDAAGNAVLVAQWSVSGGGEVNTYQFAEKKPLEGVGYDALVAAETQLLVQFASSIAKEL